MKKLLAVAVLAIFAIVAPGLAFADSVSYLQGQQNNVITGGSQAQVYIGFAGQTQAGQQASQQGQVSLNHADQLHVGVVSVTGPFNIPLGSVTTVKSDAVNANGANSQGQASGYVQTQGGAGLALGLQKQGTVQTQSQLQISTGSAH